MNQYVHLVTIVVVCLIIASIGFADVFFARRKAAKERQAGKPGDSSHPAPL